MKTKHLLKKLEVSPFMIPSGFISLDKLINGFHRGCLYTIAGRPSMGKTTLALNIALNATVKFKKPTVFFSNQMIEEQIFKILTTQISQISFSKLTKNNLTDFERQRLIDKTQPLTKAPLSIKSIPKMDLKELIKACKKLVKEDKIQLIIIDDIQSVTVNGNRSITREQEVSYIVRKIKSLSLKLKTSFLITSQINKQTETRGGTKKPLLIDLKYSGEIENASDVILLIYRPEYYGLSENADGFSTKDLAEIIIGKNKFGPSGETCFAEIKYLSEYLKFEDFETIDSELYADQL